MRIILLCFILMIALYSCKKESVQLIEPDYPTMRYQDLNDTVLDLSNGRYEIDVDEDGTLNLMFAIDVAFNISTGITQKRAVVVCIAGTFMPFGQNDGLTILSYGDKIDMKSFLLAGYKWNNAWLGVLASKSLTPQSGSWVGDWKDSSHKYLPFFVDARNGQHVNYGWIELSFNSLTEQIILHKSGIATRLEYDKPAKAGY